VGLCVQSSHAREYWQQEVNYVLDVTLAEDLRTINGTIDIEYINNSPDTLDLLYLKAFPNAIQRNSYADKKRRTQNIWTTANLKKEQEGSLELFDTEPASRTYRRFERDNTIITVYLDELLVPSDTVLLTFKFTTVLPSPHEMRMGLIEGTVKAAYWYPQVCVYDNTMGWVNSQYVDWGECYGDFGKFDVTITAPAAQIIAATGVCVNESEVLSDSLRQMYALENYLKPKSEWPIFSFAEGETKTWHYVAEKVNDFAFTSSARFCLDTGTVNGVDVAVYPLRENAKGWIHGVRLGQEAIQTFSEKIYPYQWPVIRITDAYSGMEFPMLANCRGGAPSKGWWIVVYHEIGHQWFMGQVGSNQVDRPFLDEGFTTHIEHIAIEQYLGRAGNNVHFTNWYEKLVAPLDEDRNERGFRQLLLLMKQGLDRPMSFSYDQGEEYWPYRVSAYYKSAAMHYSLRSILGDSAYFDAMHDYCDRWFFRHPYEDDFTESLEQTTGLQLNQFFDQWYHGRQRLDYAFAGKKSQKSGRGYRHTISLKQKGRFVSPVDVGIIWAQGDTSFYTVAPEGMAYAKPGFALLPIWHQFRRLDERYNFSVNSERKIKKVIVDPDNLLMDINRLNNQSGLPPIQFRLDNLKYDRVPVNEYALRARPDIWYDDPNGVQLGFHAHGSYLQIEKRFNLDARIGTRSGRPNVDFTIAVPFAPFGDRSELSWRVLRADRRLFYSNAFQKYFSKWHSRPDHKLFRLELNYLKIGGGKQANRLDPISEDVSKYFADPAWDATDNLYSALYTDLLRTFRYGSYHFYNANYFGALEEDGNYSGFLSVRYLFGLKLTNSTRTYCALNLDVVNITGQPSSQFIYQLSRGRAVDAFTSTKLFRSPGTFPLEWRDNFYLGLGPVRGYQDRAIYFTESYAGSVELTPPDIIPFRFLAKLPLVGGFLSKIDNALFVDAASVSMEEKEVYYPVPISTSETALSGGDQRFYLSAGISLLSPPVWSNQHLRLDFPLYLNKPAGNEKEFEFRFSVAWQFGEIR